MAFAAELGMLMRSERLALATQAAHLATMADQSAQSARWFAFGVLLTVLMLMVIIVFLLVAAAGAAVASMPSSARRALLRYCCRCRRHSSLRVTLLVLKGVCCNRDSDSDSDSDDDSDSNISYPANNNDDNDDDHQNNGSRIMGCYAMAGYRAPSVNSAPFGPRGAMQQICCIIHDFRAHGNQHLRQRICKNCGKREII